MHKFIVQMEPWFDKKEADAVYSYMKGGGWVTEFKKTQELEEEICRYTGAKYCVMTNNGTVSLTLALLALEVKPLSEVLVPNLTMIATPNSAVLIGIKPILVDVEKDTLCLDLEKAQRAITKKTKAVIYVSFNGRSGNMGKVTKFCQENHLLLIEDAAQALGSLWEGKHLGTFGQIGSFSFSVPKIITTGQGGALVTDDRELYKKIKRLKDFGRNQGGIDIHDLWGWNFKFTDLQAVIGLEQMKKLKTRVLRKKEIYKKYHQLLSGINEIQFIATDLENTTPWFVDIYVNDPDNLMEYLKKKRIGSRRIYPAISTQKIYKNEYKNQKFTNSEEITSKGLWLPSSSNLTDSDINRIAKTIRKYYNA